ncbi:MAG: tyrosine--tRNA ligase [Candidatus Moeniiplasma glomeromycotorum]|nr:tyrosine--tRNA ligase [Candidatus Moeniiplasma glomeromycotorum]MCE8167174.1 tyrosine--tRNA ligase [Candidatus Moeniiplasma glomeromycotorum]MCE8168814.1 tyrosine--tRNA ligase [Candidatus Moeniiplasma glomeromycotorum]
MSTELKSFFQDLQKRGIIANYANLDNFYQLKPEEKVIYLGVDCTSESLHIGHLFLYFQTIRFAQAGFTVLLILGGATSKIGDPSDKDKERPLLAVNQIEDYQTKIKSQLERILIKPKKVEKVNFSPLEQFYSDNPQLLSSIYQILNLNSLESKEKQWENYLSYIWTWGTQNNFQILNNQDWLEKLSFIDFLRQTGKYLTVAYLSNKETIKKRIDTGLSFLEFSYPLIQAYDFFHLYENYHCHGQLGGSDQWGNLTTGLKLIRAIYPENRTFAFTFKLLTNKEGKKYSKSEKKTLRLDGKKKELVDFFLNLSDEEVQAFIRQLTFLEESQIRELSKIPSRLRVLQKIMVELVWFLNYGEVESLKSVLEIRKERVPSGWRRKKREEEKYKKVLEVFLQKKKELEKKVWWLRSQRESLKIQRLETEVKKIEEELIKEERKFSELEYYVKDRYYWWDFEEN